ncbi:RNA polymerase sigma-70 factor [Pedobacter psychroterrae]|uniref:RNA polymerase sigma-70 factor n=1 Tax=Pedobacter psychroterrae TaxID=2530453 RepID=A0A4R0NP40_9SPHI|nr:RNA polymerase sigma-70 factor [Pedobacter psychroterrae]TCD02732.1 RNA polymerase sigma-70 factor [Pedobacter psychroterrae]
MPDYKTYSDSQLTDLLKTADHAAYTEIYNRYYHLMFVFAYKKLRDEDQAKDFVQELFTNLWVKREQLQETTNLTAFLYTALRNKVLNYIARQKVESKYIQSLKDYTNTGSIAHTDHLVREKQFQDHIDKEIQALPKKMRKAFELSRIEHLANRDIADKLNVTENNVSQHINNAIRILRTKLSAIFVLLLF